MGLTTINARVKAIRKSKRLNQSEFGKIIGLKQGGVSAMEQEGATVTEQNISLICQKFRVSRDWLEKGEGDMFIEGEPGIFREFAKEYQLSIPEQHVAKYLLKLSHTERDQILRHLCRIAAAMQEGRKQEREERQKAQEDKDIQDFANDLFHN
ncbi:MAG: helix-turn-helix domain-containing protein [Selenomonas sp.]|nr:helix-turn-helix domain-containing protein [Selenomonas sp.]